jgi:hypothetical protein
MQACLAVLWGAPEAATVAGGKADMRTSYQLGRSIRVLVAASLAAIPLGLVAFPAMAQDAAAPPSAPQTNATRPSQGYKPYFIEFRARAAASYGHMYVLYGQLNGRGEIVKSDIAGLHPAGDANNCDNCSLLPWTLGHILFVPSETGASDGDLEEKYVTARYRVMLDAASFNKVSAHIKQKKAEKQAWNALINNCVTFINEIAGFMGLKTPPGSNLIEPKDYVERLRDMNGGKPQKALRFAAPASSASPASAAPPAASKPKKDSTANLSARTAGTSDSPR